ncbi:helicase-associated protein [Arthrobacter sp. TB 26]|uniref:helicase-associated protein n=1 Tax=Arthrobacter sp. TB 26 TaxID=494420 RepID=UPI001ED9B9A4|nr:helicase-associated protein [Arthrobacter sp. TB 26]
MRRAPDAEWVLMYRLGLSRKRIAELVRAEPAAVGYHLVIARRQDPGFEAEHRAAASAAPVPHPSPTDLARMAEVIAWVLTESRLPEDRAGDRAERSMARWISTRRREPAQGTLDPAYSQGLARVPGWAGNRRGATDEVRWQGRLAGSWISVPRATIGRGKWSRTEKAAAGAEPAAAAGEARCGNGSHPRPPPISHRGNRRRHSGGLGSSRA